MAKSITWQTEKRKLSDLLPWERNPRQLTEAQAEHLEESLSKFGLVDPPAINTDNVIIGGHQRRNIMGLMKEYGNGAEIDVRVPSRTLTEREVEELNIRLNKNTGSFDFDALANNFEVDDLLDWGFEPFELGIEDVVDDTDAEPQFDRAEELREKWGVELGQLWQLGEHRLICGDCTDEVVVGRLMKGGEAGFTFTDPPYNVGVAYGDSTDDNQSKIGYVQWCQEWLNYVPDKLLLTVGIKRLLWWGNIVGDPQWIVAWIKRNGQGQTGLSGTNKWDPILVYGVSPDKDIDIVELNNDYSEGIKAASIHPTSKPVDLWARMIARFSWEGESVYEPFTGTGTTLIACEHLNRKCYGVEIEPKYVAVTLQRYYDAFGIEPVLIS